MLDQNRTNVLFKEFDSFPIRLRGLLRGSVIREDARNDNAQHQQRGKTDRVKETHQTCCQKERLVHLRMESGGVAGSAANPLTITKGWRRRPAIVGAARSSMVFEVDKARLHIGADQLNSQLVADLGAFKPVYQFSLNGWMENADPSSLGSGTGHDRIKHFTNP